MENKNNLVIIVIMLIVAVGIAGTILINKSTKNSPQNEIPIDENVSVEGIVLYYSLTCPHCKNVEEFINANDISAKVNFIQKEVGENSANASEMVALAGKCGIKSNAVGVPFLWDGGKCIIGDQDIINFFKIQANIN